MEKSCPECAAKVEFTPVAAQMQSGTCPSCEHTILILAAGGPPLVAPAPEPSEAPASGDVLLFPCPECGSPTTLTVKGRMGIAAECDVCDRTILLRPPRAPDAGGEREERPAAPRPRGRDESGDEGRRFGGERAARPCRECGAPLRFETNEDGGVTGTCDSCGNRFTLPRREGGDRRSGGGGREGGSYGRGRPGGFRRFGGPPTRGRFGDRRGPPRRRERRDDDA
jgi:hypothetical protein